MQATLDYCSLVLLEYKVKAKKIKEKQEVEHYCKRSNNMSYHN